MCNFDFKYTEQHCPGCQCVKHCPGCKCKKLRPEDVKITWTGPQVVWPGNPYNEYFKRMAESIQKIIDAGKQCEDLQDKG